ncbi:hypothetical protein DYB26_014302, partial [Aphanomyces astaci]
MAEASSDENKSDESMLTEDNDDNTLTQSVVPLTSTSPIARLDSNDSYSSSNRSHSYEDRVSREVERLSCDVEVLGRLLHEQLPASPALSDDTRPCLEALRQENQLLHERVSSLVHDKTLLQDRVLLLETCIHQLSLDFSSRLAQASIPAPPSSGYRFQLPSELTALLTKMSSEMADVKEAIDTSSSNQAFGRAVKYTTIPSSDAHDHCEYFMKQLVEQADRG